MNKLIVVLTLFIISILLLTGCTTTAPAPSKTPAPDAKAAPAPQAESVADFFKKNTITVIAPFTAGGGSDFACRLFASYWPDVTGGAMIIKNMTGGGGLVGANFVAAAKPDGLTLCFGNTTSSHVIPYALKDAALKFNPLEQIYLGSIFNDPNMATVGVTSPHNSWKDIKAAADLKFGSVGPSSVSAIAIALWADALGLDSLKMITGYGGGAALRLALAKKEIDGMSTPIHDTYLAIKDNICKTPFLIMAETRNELYPNTPTILEVATEVAGGKLSPEKTQLYKAGIILSSSFRSLIAPAGLPADKVKFLRDAFDKVANTQAFKDQALGFFPQFTKPSNGDETTKMVTAAASVEGNAIKALVTKYMALK